VAVFVERGLISLERSDGSLILCSIPGRRADLEQSVYMKELRRIIEEHTKGGC